MARSDITRELHARWSRLRTPASRNLLRELVRATIRINDHNSVLGAVWGLLGPASMLVVLYAVFHSRFGSRLDAYPLFLLVGIVAVGFFLTGSRQLIGVLTANRNFMIDSTAPREMVILSNLTPHVYKLLVELALCAGFAGYYGLLSWKTALLLPVVTLAYVGFVLGVGLVLALAYTFTSDIEHVWVLGSRLLYFATPVFYELGELSPVAAGLVYWLNPVTPFLLALRTVFFDATTSLAPVFHAIALGPLALIAGYFLFLRFEAEAIERI